MKPIRVNRRNVLLCMLRDHGNELFAGNIFPALLRSRVFRGLMERKFFEKAWEVVVAKIGRYTLPLLRLLSNRRRPPWP